MTYSYDYGLISHVVDYKNKYSPPHTHPLEEIIIAEQGHCTLHNGNETTELFGPFLIYSPRRVVHRQLNDENAKYSRYSMRFDSKKLLGGIEVPDFPFSFELSESGLEQLKFYLDQLYTFHERGEDTDGKVYSDSKRNLLISLVVNEVMEIARPHIVGRVSMVRGIIHDICDYIDLNLSDKLTFEGICKHFYISRAKLARDFKEQTGMSVCEYITTLRLSNAAYLLEHTSLPLDEIARQCGYSGANYFIKAFGKNYDITPNKYRFKYK